jgi:hypothetical protein
MAFQHPLSKRTAVSCKAYRQAVARPDAARRKAEAKEKEFVDKINRLKAALGRM